MIITQTPFRMSFFGGGTDMESFFKEYGGAVLSTTFDKYCYVNVRHLPRFFDYSTELSYSKTERVTDINDIQHPAIRNAMKMLDMSKYESFVVTEHTEYKATIKDEKMYYVHQVNRKEMSFPFWMVVNALKSIIIFLREKPDVVITTGVLAMIPLCLIAKLFGKKLIYIESFAKVSSPTETGRFLYKFADRFYVQWKPMLQFYPKAIYLGGIY